MTTLTHLQPGMIVIAFSQQCRVVMVNESRAVLVPLRKNLRCYVPKTGKNAGKTVLFAESPRPISVSPNSDVPILSGVTSKDLAITSTRENY